jgi:hypothetical protein
LTTTNGLIGTAPNLAGLRKDDLLQGAYDRTTMEGAAIGW